MDRNFQSEEIIILITAGVFIMLLLTFVLIAFFVLSQQKLNNERQKAHEQQLQHSEQLLFSTLQTQENERSRIAKDLHDDVGSKLNVLNLNLYRLQKQTTSLPEAHTTVRDLFQIIHTTIDTTRRISHDLLPPALESFGLPEALSELCTQYRQSGQLDIEYEVGGDPAMRLDKTAEISIFRVVQELLSNSVRHGSATSISLRVGMMPLELFLDYADNGCGFDMTAADYKPGLGLQNIESRMRMIGAEYRMESAISAGLNVHIQHKHREI